MVVMVSETYNFDSFGPKHLTYVNWDNAYHRKSIAASLVNGVYVLENDRQKQRKGPDSLAGPAQRFKPQPSICNNTLHRSPRYVIAFRGTIIKPKSFMRDMKLDLKIIKHGLHGTSRSKIATETVSNMVANVGGNGSNIWLAGHSLGSCLALHAGKTMAKSDILIESFLFNPPFPSIPLDRIIKSKKVKQVVRLGVSEIRDVFGILNPFKKSSSNDSFVALSAWVPRLFVNASDYICSKYVEYFEQRGSRIEKIAIRSHVMNVFGKECEPLHLIPLAILTMNLTPQQNFIKAHRIDQWRKPDLQLESKLIEYKSK
ncbi:hypothetical protein P8452_40649 [Trifolium repens]|nr:hypothetical protein P8452_40649 [Trifolium repens]